MPYFDYKGKKVHFVDKGQGDTLLLLPGNTSSSLIHSADIDYFATGFRVVCPDYPGYGKSERVEKLAVDFWWSNAELCKELLSFLEQENCIALGSSGGGIIALNLAIIAPALVRAVVADSITGEFANGKDFERQVQMRKNAPDELRTFWQMAHGEDWERIIELDSQLLIEASMRQESFYRGRLKEINCPVLLTGSLSDDAISDVEVNICSVARQITNSKTIFFPTGGHPLMWSRPEDFRENVMQFLERI